MVEQDRYCIDTLNQMMAIRVALFILQDHADDCVVQAISAREPEEQWRKLRELIEAFEKVCR